MFKENTTNREKQCHFCVNNIRDIDYKDIESLKTFLDGHAHLKTQETVCSLHQRKLGSAIKRADLWPFAFINGWFHSKTQGEGLGFLVGTHRLTNSPSIFSVSVFILPCHLRL